MLTRLVQVFTSSTMLVRRPHVLDPTHKTLSHTPSCIHAKAWIHDETSIVAGSAPTAHCLFPESLQLNANSCLFLMVLSMLRLLLTLQLVL